MEEVLFHIICMCNKEEKYLVIWEITIYGCFKLSKKLIEPITASKNWKFEKFGQG